MPNPKYSTYINLFNLYDNAMKHYSYDLCFYRQENRGTEGLRNLLKVKKVGSDITESAYLV